MYTLMLTGNRMLYTEHHHDNVQLKLCNLAINIINCLLIVKL